MEGYGVLWEFAFPLPVGFWLDYMMGDNRRKFLRREENTISCSNCKNTQGNQ